jgi:hypothetical protein
MAMVVRAFPILPGKEQAARDFAALVGSSRRGEASLFYQRYGVTRESWHLQKTDDGAFIIVVTELGAAPAVDAVHAQAHAYAKAQGTFERWFKDSVRDLCGVNPDEQPLGPPTETILDWSD